MSYDFSDAINRFASLAANLPDVKREHIRAMVAPICDEIARETNKLAVEGLNRFDLVAVEQQTMTSNDSLFEALETSPYRGFLAMNFIMMTRRGSFEDVTELQTALMRFAKLPQ